MKNKQPKITFRLLSFFQKRSFLLVVIFFKWMSLAVGQNTLYFAGNLSGSYGLGYVNIETCEVCVEFEVPLSLFPQGMNDLVPLPNGNVVAMGQGGQVLVFNPPNPVPLSTFDLPGSSFAGGGVLLPNGNVYITAVEFVGGNTTNQLFEFNPSTNTAVLIGIENSNNYFIGEPFFWQGMLYTFGTGSNGFGYLFNIQVGNPLVFNPVYSYPGLCGAPTATISSGPFAGIYTGAVGGCSGSDLDIFDLPNNTATFQCEVSPNGFPYGLGEIPSGFPPPSPLCGCTTNAGQIPTANTILCANENLIFTNTGGFLDPSDIKQFILFTDLNDPTGSIVAISNTPEFAFDPPLQTGVTYFVAAIAGNDAGGNVDLNDPCLDLSNSIEVLWNPLPTVAFSISQSEICAGDCQTVEAVFTGTPPFILTYESSGGGGPQTQSFVSNSGILLICPPVGFSGGLTVQAVNLSDGNCVCGL